MSKLRIIFAFFLSFILFSEVNADDSIYQIIDNNSGFSDTFDNYSDAYDFYLDNIDKYDNLLFLKNDKVIFMEYGIVEFIEDNIIEYHSTIRKQDDSICGSYGIDGAYLSTSKDGERVYFVISGDRGYTTIDNVVLHPYETLDVGVSVYNTKNNYLYHNIMTQLQTDYYSLSLCLDIKPSFLEDNNNYFSYDGHYFYNDFYTMIDDYKNDDNNKAINSEPYYNYYQYLSHRSISNYSIYDLENYFYNNLGIDGRLIHYNDFNNDGAADEVNRSQFYGNINEFFNCQGIYGTNAMMLISSAIVESSYGKSLNSFINNNLYSNAAFDTENEKNNGRYDCISNSIYSHAKYFIGDLYSNHLKQNYYGTNYGNKLSGINIEYTLDHYYGEKAASIYFKLDSALGLKDYNSCAIAIIKDDKSLNFYKDEELNNKLYKIENVSELSFIVLKEFDKSYKIQIDSSLDNDYFYNFEKSIAYISKEDVDIFLNKDKIHDNDLTTISYDFMDGKYFDEYIITAYALDDEGYMNIIPKKDGYEFVGYDKSVIQDGTKIFDAQYKKINYIKIKYLFENNNEIVPYADLSKAKISVVYSDKTNKDVDINSDMISVYDNKSSDTQKVCVSYCGLSANKEFNIDTSYYDSYNKFEDAVLHNDYTYIKDNIKNINYPFTMSQIRQVDYSLKNINKRNYVIKDNTKKYNISISGLDMSLDNKNSFNKIDDTYYVIVNDINESSYNKIINVAKGYGFDTETGINIKFRFNYQNIELNGPVIIQLDLNDKKTNYIYSVYHLNDNGDVIKCRTTQSDNYIQFMAYESGDYEVLSMPSSNHFDIDDNVEDLSYENMGFDNNKTNIEFLFGFCLILISLIGIILYYIFLNKKDRQWRDYKKLLRKADTVQEEKQNN